MDGESLRQKVTEVIKGTCISGEIRHGYDHYLFTWRNKAGVETEWKVPRNYTDDDITVLLVTMRLTC